MYAMAPGAVVKNGLAGRRDLDTYEKVKSMLPPDSLKLKEVTLEADESSDRESEAQSVKKLAEHLEQMRIYCTRPRRSRQRRAWTMESPGASQGSKELERTAAEPTHTGGSGCNHTSFEELRKWQRKGRRQRQRQERREGEGQG